MLALNQTFDETRSVKVLVVPIGNNSLFNDHFQVVSNLRDVPFYELNRPPAASNANSAFKHFNWNDGNLLFDFLRYDRVLIGPGDLSNFQSSKRVLMIMGLINYPELGATADSIEEELEYFARRHPNILLRRIFVFNYSFDDPQAHSNVAPLYTRIRDPASLVIFPPDGTCGSNSNSEGFEYEDAINHASHSMVDVHLQEVMSHAALHIVLALETQVKLCEENRVKNILPEGLPMSTLFDELDSEASPREGLATNTLSTTSGGVLSSYGNSNKSLVSRKAAANMYKKKPSGRIHKWMGDLCMQACTPRDAYEHYANSISECKALGEQLWLAGALDGFASSVVLLLHMHANVEEICSKEFKNMLTTSNSNNGIGAVGVNTFVDNSSNCTTESVVEKAYRLVEDRMNDAISIYSSSIVFCALEVECILRVASMFETSTVHPNKELKVLEYVLRAVAVPGFNAQQQIEVTLEGGLRCHRMGLWRKYALFLYIAALQSADNESYGVAHALIRYACSEYGIQTTSTSTTTTGDQLSPLQATSVPHSGNIGCVRLGHHSHSTSTSTSTSNGNLNITNDVHGTGGDSSTAAPASAVTTHSKNGNSNSNSNSSSSNGVWSGLRTSLFSTAALIADEHGDPLAATQYLVSLMQLIQEGEHTHCATRRHWLNMSSHQLFEESGNNMNTTTHGYSNNNNNNTFSTATGIAANPSKVRWENDLSAPGTNAPNTPTPSATDISPVPRRSKSTADSDYNYNNNSNNTNNNNNNYTEDYTPPPAGNRPTSYSLSQQVNKNNISPMVSRRLDTGNSTDDFADNNNNNNNSGNSEKQRNMRRLTVPALSERLNSLSHLTHAAAAAPRPKNINTMQNTYNVTTNPNKPGEFLIDRFLRTLSTQADSGMSVNYANYANAVALNSALANNNNTNNSGVSNSTSEMYSAAIAADTLDAMAQLVSSSRYSVEVQEEIHGLFARLSKSIVPSTTLPLPLSMYHVRPVVLTGRAKPTVVQCSALTAARRNWQLYKDKATLSGTIGALGSTGVATTAEGSSSLFYDPFAAKRQKAHNLAQQHALLYSVHSPCTLKVTFSNPLSIPVLLNAVFPVLTGVEHTVYPISVQIPPNAEQYTIELVFLCKSLGTVVVQGVQFVINNATHLLRVDKEGNYSDPTRSGPVPKRIGNTTTTATSEVTTAPATVATNTILTVPAAIPLILTTSCSSQAPPLTFNTDPVGTIVDANITTTSTSQRRVSTTTNSGAKSTQNVVTPDEVAHVTLYPGETRVETVQLHTTHSMNMQTSMKDAIDTADSTQETHIRVTLHQYTEHTTHNTKNNSNTITHKTTSNVVLDYTGPLQSPDIVNTNTSNTTNTANTATNAINACSLQSYIHQVSPLPESHTNTVNNVSSLLTQLTLAFHHNTTANTTVKYVDIEIEVCNAPATVFTSINLLKQDNSACDKAIDGIEEALDLTLYSRIHRLRVYIHSVPGLTATTIAPLHTSTRLSLPSYQLNNVEASLHTLLLQNKVNPAVSHNKPGDNSACNNPVRLLPNEMGVVLEVRNTSEWWMLVALSKTQVEHTVRTMYQQGTLYTNSTTTTSSPFNGSSGAIENATVVSHSDITNIPGALLLLPPKSARSVVIQYPTHCYDTNSASASATATNSIAVSKGTGASVDFMSLLWAAVDLSRNATVNYGDPAEGELSRVLSNLRYGEVLLGANSNVSVHKTTSVSSSTAITTINNTDTMALSVPVDLHSGSKLIARLLSTVPQITIRTQLYGNENAAAALVPHIRDAHLGDLYSICACQFYDVSVTVSRCDWHNVSFEGDVRIELSVIVIQNEVPVLSLDDEKNKASGGSNDSDMGTKMRPCVMTGKPYCSYVLSGGQNENTDGVSAEGNSGSSVVHKLRLCFAYGGSYSVLPLVRVTPLCGMPTAHHTSTNTSTTGTSPAEINTSNGTGGDKIGSVGGSWWTATGSYVRVVAK